jgi:hypothetical protein
VKHQPVTILNVYLEGHRRHKVGRIATQNRRILFEYDLTFMATAFTYRRSVSHPSRELV